MADFAELNNHNNYMRITSGSHHSKQGLITQKHTTETRASFLQFKRSLKSHNDPKIEPRSSDIEFFF